VINVYNYGLGQSKACCSCGWSGERRSLKALATHDAWTHFTHNKCALSVPLVYPVTNRSK
jgi:hypothetical protein